MTLYGYDELSEKAKATARQEIVQALWFFRIITPEMMDDPVPLGDDSEFLADQSVTLGMQFTEDGQSVTTG